MLGELNREATKRRTMQSREKALDDPARDQLDAAKLGDRVGIEQVETPDIGDSQEIIAAIEVGLEAAAP